MSGEGKLPNFKMAFLAACGIAGLVFLSFILKAGMFRVILPLIIVALGGYLLYSVLLLLGFGDEGEEDNTHELIERDE